MMSVIYLRATLTGWPPYAQYCQADISILSSVICLGRIHFTLVETSFQTPLKIYIQYQLLSCKIWQGIVCILKGLAASETHKKWNHFVVFCEAKYKKLSVLILWVCHNGQHPVETSSSEQDATAHKQHNKDSWGDCTKMNFTWRLILNAIWHNTNAWGVQKLPPPTTLCSQCTIYKEALVCVLSA